MKAALYDLEGSKVREIELPGQFSEEYRKDIIRSAVLSLLSKKRQSYGAYAGAGKNAAAILSKRRRKYKSTYGRGQARTPRKVMLRRGMNFYYMGAFSPNTVGGRRSHPPKSGKIFERKINNKERLLAIRSAIAATSIKNLVEKRGHLCKEVPMIVDVAVEDLKKTKEVIELMRKLGLHQELERVSEKKVRAGKGKLRGRKYKTKKGPLFVVSKKCSLMDSAKNICGVDISDVHFLNAEVLAPGAVPGRLTLWSEKAIEALKKENLFSGVKIHQGENKQ